MARPNIPTNFGPSGELPRTGITGITRPIEPVINDEGGLGNVPVPVPLRRPSYEEERNDAIEEGQAEEETTTYDGESEINVGIADSVQRGELIDESAVGDESQSNANQAFNLAVGTAFNFFGLANSIRSATQSSSGSTSPSDLVFRLTEIQKQLLEEKARDFASFGVVPYDVLEDFLYVLVSIDNYNDLSYVSKVIGLIEIDEPSFVRNVDAILNAKELFRIGYIANGLAALTKQFASQLSTATNAADTDLSSFGQYSGASSPPVPSFGGLQDLVSIGTSAVALAQTVKGLTETFGEGSISDLLSQISTIPNVVTQLVSNITQVTSSVQKLTGINLGALDQQLAKLNQIAVAAKTLQRLSEQLRPISEMANADQMVADVREQLTNIQSRATDIQNRMTEVLGEIADVKPPENIGELIELFKNEPGFHLIKTVLGQVPPIQVLANNPLLKEPTGIGLRHFGQQMSFLYAMDQTFARRVAQFQSPVNATATNAFSFQNFGSFGGSQPLQNVVSRIIGGGAGNIIGAAVGVVGNTVLQKLAGDKANDIANILGVAANAAIELRRSDNAIPFMIGMASALAGENKSPFSTGVFSDGWKLASSVGNIIQDRNPGFLTACRTNL